MERRGSTAVWGVILAVALVTAVAGWWQLSGLPDIDILLGPDLTVRDIALEPDMMTEGEGLEPGDRLTHLEGSSVESLREFRLLLAAEAAQGNPPTFEEGAFEEVEEFEQIEEIETLEKEDFVELNFFFLRPVHRFTVDPI